jgi:hypothetical protein
MRLLKVFTATNQLEGGPQPTNWRGDQTGVPETAQQAKRLCHHVEMSTANNWGNARGTGCPYRGPAGPVKAGPGPVPASLLRPESTHVPKRQLLKFY